MASVEEFKTIKVSEKGQVAIPADIRRKMGIKKGDKVILILKGKKLVLEKSERIAKKLENEFKDIEDISEHSLREVWDNKQDEIWNQYIVES
ncbi:AbrB/MazE/SpoVT family DNA-binding domain-containing protein [Nitrososphaera viennensis]|uniref:AbrB/MazE/SpoVT family DNA-binding domain-containing protein n=2 Tax=Nitrososphaera viennensis TaxID=1034015 RepID=A0A977ICM6_9ARCH|nr:AbrB/MazE/SpoVT family DNA-binding domain-containing protein [Nitrososphaera viennensis]AIC16387.1 putative transcription regulator AbrB/SpoV [Nitrososphaera viennensis EN76]UVS68322.1 AbrB/MazE/SpoVT family DNA-binding domain-containing protein [Nitrososphaera viennensis]